MKFAWEKEKVFNFANENSDMKKNICHTLNTFL